MKIHNLPLPKRRGMLNLLRCCCLVFIWAHDWSPRKALWRVFSPLASSAGLFKNCFCKMMWCFYENRSLRKVRQWHNILKQPFFLLKISVMLKCNIKDYNFLRADWDNYNKLLNTHWLYCSYIYFFNSDWYWIKL